MPDLIDHRQAADRSIRAHCNCMNQVEPGDQVVVLVGRQLPLTLHRDLDARVTQMMG
jgi:hypothetical protein